MKNADAPRIFSADYYERMRRLEAGSWWNAGMRDVAGKLLAAAGLPPRGRLLDVGCGSGQTMRWFTDDHPGWTSCGVDVAPEGISAAHAMSLPAVIGSALNLPFGSQSADLVITLDVLQHLPLSGGDSAALHEMHRVLVPGGFLFVRTNAQAYPPTPDDARNDFRKYTPDLLRSRLEGAGFSIVRLSRMNALLGLAEVARELRASREQGDGYHGILAVPRKSSGIAFAAKRAVLRAEGRLVRAGLRLPLGRSIVALCVKRR